MAPASSSRQALATKKEGPLSPFLNVYVAGILKVALYFTKPDPNNPEKEEDDPIPEFEFVQQGQIEAFKNAMIEQRPNLVEIRVFAPRVTGPFKWSTSQRARSEGGGAAVIYDWDTNELRERGWRRPETKKADEE